MSQPDGVTKMSNKKDNDELTKEEIRELYNWIALDCTYEESDPFHDFVSASSFL
jgi:hypothetical protein